MTLADRLTVAMAHAKMSQAELARHCGVKPPSVHGWLSGKAKFLRGENLLSAAVALGVNQQWLATGDGPMSSDAPANQIGSTARATTSAAPAPHHTRDGGIVINQYDAGGGMDTKGRLLLEDQPGVIRSWNVDEEWLRLNVPTYSSLKNLCIVTGFGPSMRGIFNSGDPLLVDRGVNTVNHEGIYFFRVGEEGFIKIIQRVPEFDGPGFVYRIISKNEDYPPYDISAKSTHFQVIGKVLTVWRSEQF